MSDLPDRLIQQGAILTQSARDLLESGLTAVREQLVRAQQRADARVLEQMNARYALTEELQKQLAKAEQERDDFKEQRNLYFRGLIGKDLEALLSERDTLKSENARLAAELAEALERRDVCAEQMGLARGERDDARKEFASLIKLWNSQT